MSKLSVDDASSFAASIVNDDVVGHQGNSAWVIDGATDLCDEPLVDPESDAAWLANLIGRWLTRHPLPPRLGDIIPALTQDAADEFAKQRSRPPVERFEHPSAAGLILRLDGTELEYLALGDCSLVVESSGGDVVRYGVGDDTGDAGLADRLSDMGSDATNDGRATIDREGLMPILRDGRRRMNLAPGYGVFSITAPPSEHVVTERVQVATGTRLLLASDGFMRLVDVFQAYSLAGLIECAFARGIPAMVDELRTMEREDAAGHRFPRAKCHDDASALLGRVVS